MTTLGDVADFPHCVASCNVDATAKNLVRLQFRVDEAAELEERRPCRN
jgi:hypothetical protein